MAFLKSVFGSKGTGSKNLAKERLQLVLVHDRSSISPEIMNLLREDLIKTISKYMDIDTDRIELELDPDFGRDSTALVANIPVLKMKRNFRE